MPNYDYRCLNCKRRFVVYMSYSEYGTKPVTCPHCQSGNVQRRIGRIRMARSEASRMESMADPAALDGIDQDPRALGRMMRQMSSEMGEEMGPEFNEVVNRLEKGQSPEDIDKDFPELASGGDDMGADSDFGGGMDF
jgi:putative FmdB family regulatory protein